MQHSSKWFTYFVFQLSISVEKISASPSSLSSNNEWKKRSKYAEKTCTNLFIMSMVEFGTELVCFTGVVYDWNH